MTNTISHTAGATEKAHTIRCPLCWTLPGNGPCQRNPAGDHLARLVAAVNAGLLTKGELAEVVGGLTVIADHVVILERRPACWYCDRTGLQLEPCCEHHPDDLVCADRADCKDFALAQLAETRQA